MSAPIHRWVAGALGAEVETALERLAGSEDVCHVAVMPDVHLADTVCVGVATATTTRILPQAVGGDIGCGMAALRFAASGEVLRDKRAAAALLAGLYRVIPFIKHAARDAPPLPPELEQHVLSNAALETLKRRDGRLQFGTLGRGNHFVEFQVDEDDALWLMVHSGSRAMGPAIRDHHLRSPLHERGLHGFAAESDAGAAYLHDLRWARRYAELSRALMMERITLVMGSTFGIDACDDTRVDCDHNHVARELHAGRLLWVHRKGALRAFEGDAGVIPGSMGSASYHVIGRGEPAALCSSSHGAGRAMSRTDARARISGKAFSRDTEGVWFDHRLSHRLREEAPAAYKDIGAVMRAQHALTRIVRRLSPSLVYKGG